MFVPSNVRNSHWVLILVDQQLRVATYHDSMGTKTYDHARKLMRQVCHYIDLIRQQNDPFNTLQYVFTDWKYITSKDIYTANYKPPQTNGDDCGSFVIKYIESYVFNYKFQSVKQCNIQRTRSRIKIVFNTILSTCEQYKEHPCSTFELSDNENDSDAMVIVNDNAVVEDVNAKEEDEWFDGWC